MIWSSPEMNNLQAVNNPVVGYSVLYKSFQRFLDSKGINLNNDIENAHYLHFMPPHFWVNLVKKFKGGKKVVVSMWESDRVDPAWCEIANEHFEALIVPSTHNKRIFEEGGLTIPCYVVKLGVNTQYFKLLKREVKDTFYFLHYNAGESRKGWYILAEAFREEFANDENIKLIVKNSSVRQGVMNRVLSNNPDLNKKVEAHRGHYTIDQMLELAQKAHCFVFPALGEGYGYTPREMLSTGMPTIISSGHAFDDLGDEYIKLPTTLKHSIDSFKPAVEKSFAHSELISDVYKGQNLWYVDKDELRAKMRDVYNNWNTYYKEAQKNAKRIWKQENPETCLAPLIDILEKHY